MFITHFDSKYVRWGKILLHTHNDKYNGAPIYVSGVNLRNEDIEELQSIHPGAIIDNEILKLEDIPITKTRDRWGGQTGHNLPEFMACRKSWVLQSAFEKFPDEPYYVMTDADIFINRYYDFMDGIKNTDAGFLIGGDPGQTGQGLHTQVMSGLIVVKNNDATHQLVNEWVNKIKNNSQIEHWKQWEWFWDQLTLNLSLQESLKQGLKISQIPHQFFVNTQMSSDAYLWSPHTGGEHRKEQMYKYWNSLVNLSNAGDKK